MARADRTDRRKDAEAFVRRWSGRGYEKGEASSFWIDLFQTVLGLDDAIERLQFEVPIKTLASDSSGFIDVHIPSASTIVEMKSSGVDLAKKEMRQGRMVTPAEQARDYANGFPYSLRPRYLIACNFEEMWVYDTARNPLADKPLYRIPLEDLPRQVDVLRFLSGEAKPPEVLAREVSVEAGRIMGRLHEHAERAYGDTSKPSVQHAVSVLLTRLMFLMFAEDAGLLLSAKKDGVRDNLAFRDYVRSWSPENLSTGLKVLFDWLDTKPEDRDPYASEKLRAFPYVNGGLFREKIPIPTLDEDFRHTLIVDGCQEFDWSGVSPTVFGSIFEGALSPDHRRRNGQHFTTPEAIHRVIDPLFLDDLKEKFVDACNRDTAGGARTKALLSLQDEIAAVSVLDPAAGSGNFLTESYLSLRRLENRVLFELSYTGKGAGDQTAFSGGLFSDAMDLQPKVSLANFHGIELEDYACCVARTALWIAEIQADRDTSKVLTVTRPALPLNDYEGIVCANALRIDWNDVVSSDKVTHICGNPPFLGSYRLDAIQKADRKDLFGAGGGVLDYVACWYLKAAEYMGDGPIKAAFVSTNSICQGQQVEPLWRRLFSLGFHIDFAWTTFFWSSEADDPAHVHVVIVGFSKTGEKPRVLHRTREGEAVLCDNINGYLMAAPDWFVTKSTRQASGMPEMSRGCQPTGKSLIMTDDEARGLVDAEPEAARWIRPFSMGKDFVDGEARRCLWLKDATLNDIASMPLVEERVKEVRDFRLASPKAATRKKAATPWLFDEVRDPEGTYIGVPKVTSANRTYIPMGFVTDGMVPGDKLYFIPTGSLFLFGVLMSRFHNAWMRMTCGRLKSDYSYSNTIVYNTFVFPTPNESKKSEVERCAQAVLDARAAHPDSSLAEMYDGISPVPEGATGAQARKFDRFVFSDLKAAHDSLDAAVEAAYGVDFGGDEERIVNHLFGLYAEAVREGER
ncbi:methylase [Granulimonas faecalis]|uniref:site-specific DNA-methyltransferase (adenine-specific) n=1 Tax=Granulimonas faecalis TaxID=2894155 RepID=A0AAV5B467_9ACTN|nr:DNA methyltransferase [Granulimonas faecalis]GJM56224.1 methylase [Granulimonas faecalis]